MKKVLLLRHAEALVEEGMDDKQRPLTGEGLQSLENLAHILKNGTEIPDFIICSTSVRTKQTLNRLIELMPEMQEAKVYYTDNIYNKPVDMLIDEIQKVDDDFNVVLLVSHNPAITQLAKVLVNDGIEDDLQGLDKGFSPANCASIAFYEDHWADVEKEKGKLIHFINKV